MMQNREAAIAGLLRAQGFHDFDAGGTGGGQGRGDYGGS
jgi:hypothetical protein